MNPVVEAYMVCGCLGIYCFMLQPTTRRCRLKLALIIIVIALLTSMKKTFYYRLCTLIFMGMVHITYFLLLLCSYQRTESYAGANYILVAVSCHHRFYKR